MEDEGLTEKAELVMAVRGYEYEDRQSWDEGVDYVASHSDSDDKILLRVVTEPRSRSGVVGVDVVNDMIETMKDEDCDRGVLISKRFSKAAKEQMRREGIRMISEKFMPIFKPQRLYLTMQDYIDGLCQAKCGHVPKKESDCKGKDPKGHYSCKIRLISDNASFHFEKGWTNLLRKDFEQLIRTHSTISNNEMNS